MLNTIASLIAIAYLPGAVIFRLPIADRPKRAALPAEERLFWSVIISIIVTTTVAFVLAAMSAYSLAALVWCNVALAAALALASLGNLRLGATAPWPNWTAVLPAVLVAAGVWMYFAAPAAEYVLGGRDPGVYMSEGIQIAQTQIARHDRPRRRGRAGADARSVFSVLLGSALLQRSLHGISSARSRRRHRDGPVSAGYPVWIAIAYGLDGVTGTRRVDCVVGDSRRLAVYFAGRRLIGPLSCGRGGRSALRARHTDVVRATILTPKS